MQALEERDTCIPMLIGANRLSCYQLVGGAIIPTRGTIVWADYSLLQPIMSFLVTMDLFNIETILGKEFNCLHPTRRMEYPWVYTKLLPLSKDEIVLEVGAGRTVFPLLIARYAKKMYTIDNDTQSVDYLRQKVQMTDIQNIKVCLGDVTNIQFASNFFDKVYSISTIEHIPTKDTIHAIDELLRVTKVGGRVIITMDVMLEHFDEQIDLDYLGVIAKHYEITIPQVSVIVPIFKVPPHDKGFVIACLELCK